jgi:hypothetical protein
MTWRDLWIALPLAALVALTVTLLVALLQGCRL